MSRPDSHDLEYPPGLGGFLRSNGGPTPTGNGVISNGDEGSRIGGASYPGVDRRTSMPFGGYPLFQQAAAAGAGAGAGRSLASPDWDHQHPNLHSNHHHHHHQPPQQLHPFTENLSFFRPPLSSPPELSSSPPSATIAQGNNSNIPSNPANNANNTVNVSRSTLWWGELEPWMDEEYAKQVCNLMGWEPSNIKVPRPPPDSATGQQPNNPGYAYLTFPSPGHAAAVLAQVNNSSSAAMTMPNSSKPFSLNWASGGPNPMHPHQQAQQQPPSAPMTHQPPFHAQSPPPQQALQSSSYQKEYSIFVGDLAPETSNSDLVAVFRNPVLGLRNDREPKFIRPFLSCKSAKIMLDPVTGVSRGYGFVRFTDERDQQRALIEMHGLYCLSRPMRISPATAKYKPPSAHDVPQMQFSQHNHEQAHQAPHQGPPQSSNNKSLPPSVSAPIAAVNSAQSLNSLSPSGSSSNNSLSSPFTPSSSEDLMNLPPNVLAQIAQQYANSDNGSSSKHPASAAPSITAQFAQDRNQPHNPQQQGNSNVPPYMLSEESWKHHAQARAILGNLIGPNGEQLTSTDPYNTTVFVGGLSPLIAEDTLRTFFAPFGDIHYVKVPVGKHCGFVQFVRKADAERAIEKMQGFPVGGSRIRLSWGRSQYKAAQAAAQAAQAAALQQFPAPPPNVSSPPPSGLTQQQAIELLQKLAAQGYINPSSTSPSGSGSSGAPYLQSGASTAPPSMPSSASATDAGVSPASAAGPANVPHFAGLYGDDKLRAALLTSRLEPAVATNGAGGQQQQQQTPGASTQQPQQQRFSPFSPDPNMFFSSGSPASISGAGAAGAAASQATPRGNHNGTEALPHPSKVYNSGFFSSPTASGDEKTNGSGAPSASTSPPSSHTTVGGFSSGDEGTMGTKVGRHPPISRPSSGQPRVVSGSVAELDTMYDLNGTLASLDLGRTHINGTLGGGASRPWKSPVDSESSGSVQFRMTPSP